MPTSRPAGPISDRFLTEGAAMAARHGWNWLDLLLNMNAESNLNPGAYNPAGAHGLIQIMNLPGVGWTGSEDDFLDLADYEQLPYVERYLAQYEGQNLNSHYRMHQALFLPATLPLGSDLDLVLCGADGPFAFAYNGNKLLDREGKGTITVRDLQAFDLGASKTSRFQGVLDRLSALVPEYAAQAAQLRDASIPGFAPGGGSVSKPGSASGVFVVLAAASLWAGWRLYNGQPIIPYGVARLLPRGVL